MEVQATGLEVQATEVEVQATEAEIQALEGRRPAKICGTCMAEIGAELYVAHTVPTAACALCVIYTPTF